MTAATGDLQRHLTHFESAPDGVLRDHLTADHGVTDPGPWTCLTHALVHAADLPHSTATHCEASSLKAPNAARRPALVAGSSAFRACGRSRVITVTCPSRSTRTGLGSLAGSPA